jgi:wyosine [tRNA(Phe)-imidazoG37] synthetase (radical SAM superfamily)
VPSRRLGRSLGVDLVPYKTCSYDCVYCQLGATTNRTVERGCFVCINDILQEIAARLAAGPTPNYITLSGSGEPTLQADLGVLIAGIKRISTLPVAMLTNGSLLWRPDVQDELLAADLVIPSLDAGDEVMFQRVNRPHRELHLARIIAGLESFRKRFRGELWLEVFLLGGLTAGPDEVSKLVGLLARINPARIQLNTVARPPTESYARPASSAELSRAAQLLGPRAEVIAERPAAETRAAVAPRADEILALLRRRPCTLADVAAGLGAHRLEVAKHIEHLLRAQTIVMRQHGQRMYYQLAQGQNPPPNGPRATEEE